MPGLKAMAQEEQLLILSLDEALELALKQNRKLQASKAQLAISDADIKIAKARLNPNLISDSGIAERTYRLGIEKSFELGDKRNKRTELALSDKAIHTESINTDILNLQSEVRLNFIKLFILQEKHKLFQETLDNTEALLEIFVKHAGNGDNANIDVLQIEIANLNTKNELGNIELQLNEAQNNFNALLNQPLETKLELIHPNQSPTSLSENRSINELINLAIQNRPELQQNLNTQKSAINQLKLAKANRIPNLSLTIGPDLITKSSGNDSVGVFVMSNMQIPLFNRQQGQIESAIARQAQLELEQAALAKQVELEVINSYNSLNLNKEQISRYELEITPKAQTVNEKAKRCFEEGKCLVLIPINAQQSFLSSKLGYFDSLAAYQNSVCNLERAVGVKL